MRNLSDFEVSHICGAVLYRNKCSITVPSAGLTQNEYQMIEFEAQKVLNEQVSQYTAVKALFDKGISARALDIWDRNWVQRTQHCF